MTLLQPQTHGESADTSIDLQREIIHLTASNASLARLLSSMSLRLYELETKQQIALGNMDWGILLGVLMDRITQVELSAQRLSEENILMRELLSRIQPDTRIEQTIDSVHP